MYSGISDPFLAGMLGITPNEDGTVTTHANGFTVTPGTDFADQSTSTSTTPARGGCPDSWPDWACNAVNAIGGLVPGMAETPENRANFNKAITRPLTGKDNGTTSDIVPNLTSKYQGLLIMGGAILLGVLIIVLGAWSIVKD